MRASLQQGALALLLAASTTAHGAEDQQKVIAELRARLQSLEQQQTELKARLETLSQAPAAEPTVSVVEPAPVAAPPAAAIPGMTDPRAFNPGISVILNGKLSAYDRDPGDYALPGFQLAEEAGLAARGASLDETELVMSGNIDDRYYGRLTAALHNEDGETAVELEEAFIETMGLSHGLSVRAGRFFSDIGYLNNKHPHAWAFADAPLPYRAFLGGQYKDDGVQLRWLAPTELFVETGVEVFRGEGFPAGGATNRGFGAATAFVHVGGDFNVSNTWRVGLARLSADAEDRTGTGAGAESQFSGDSDLNIVDFVWKWAPSGNPYRNNFTLQAEYFDRDERGNLVLSEDSRSSAYDGAQQGFYIQGVYQFIPRWRVGARYDRLWSDNRGADGDVLADAGLLDDGHTPQRYSLMLDYARSEYSRLRLQYNRDESGPVADNQWILQYVMSLGAHGAHSW